MVQAVHTSLSLEMERRGLGRADRWLDLQDSTSVGYLGEYGTQVSAWRGLEQIWAGGQCILSQDAHRTSQYLHRRLLKLGREVASWNVSLPVSALGQGHYRRMGGC